MNAENFLQNQRKNAQKCTPEEVEAIQDLELVPKIDSIKGMFKVYYIEKAINGYINAEALYKKFGSLNFSNLLRDGFVTPARDENTHQMIPIGIHIEHDIERKMTILIGQLD